MQSELVSLLCSYLDIGDEGHAAVLTAVAMNTPPSAAAIMTTSSGPGVCVGNLADVCRGKFFFYIRVLLTCLASI